MQGGGKRKRGDDGLQGKDAKKRNCFSDALGEGVFPPLDSLLSKRGKTHRGQAGEKKLYFYSEETIRNTARETVEGGIPLLAERA